MVNDCFWSLNPLVYLTLKTIIATVEYSRVSYQEVAPVGLRRHGGEQHMVAERPCLVASAAFGFTWLVTRKSRYGSGSDLLKPFFLDRKNMEHVTCENLKPNKENRKQKLFGYFGFWK